MPTFLALKTFSNKILKKLKNNSNAKMSKKKCRHFLFLTISNSTQFERNWEHSPLVYEKGLCRRVFSNCNSLTLRRWKSVRTFEIDGQSDLTRHKFADLNIFDVTDFAAGEMPTNFMEENQNESFEKGFNCLEKGLYEELSTVEWEGERTDDESDQSDRKISTESFAQSNCSSDYMTMGEQNANERLGESSGFILVGHPSIECHQQQTVGQFVSDWHNWTSVRALCATLPPKCAFRRLSFYRRRFGNCRYAYILLAQLEDALAFVHPISNCLNNAQSLLTLSPRGVYMDFYREIEFEIDLEVLQQLVESSKSISCVANRLVVQFGDECSANGNNSFSKNDTPFSLYRRGNFRCSSASVSNSFSISSDLNLDLINRNYDESDGEQSEFDVQMEEIVMGKDEKENETAEEGKTEEEDMANNNNGSRSRRRTTTTAPAADDGTTVDGYDYIRFVRGHRNIENCVDKQEIGKTKWAAWDKSSKNGRERRKNDGTRREKAATRQRSGFSLLMGPIGTLWRKIASKL